MNKMTNRSILGNTREQTFDVGDLVRIDNQDSPILDAVLMSEYKGSIGVVAKATMWAGAFTYDVIIDDTIEEFFPDELVLLSKRTQ